MMCSDFIMICSAWVMICSDWVLIHIDWVMIYIDLVMNCSDLVMWSSNSDVLCSDCLLTESCCVWTALRCGVTCSLHISCMDSHLINRQHPMTFIFDTCKTHYIILLSAIYAWITKVTPPCDFESVSESLLLYARSCGYILNWFIGKVSSL